MGCDANGDIKLLWQAFLKGDDKAFAGIYFTFINPLLSYGRKLTSHKEILTDAVQDVFVDMYEKRRKIHTEIVNIKAYLFVAMRNSILKKLEHMHKYGAGEAGIQKPGEFRMEFSCQDKWIEREITEENCLRLQRAVRNLSSGQKEIIYLKFEEGLGYGEISKALGITVESARKQLYRALVSLRNLLDQESLIHLFALFLKKP